MSHKSRKQRALDRLREALKPFADVLMSLDSDMEDVYLYLGKKDELGTKPHLKLKDFENAKDVLGE